MMHNTKGLDEELLDPNATGHVQYPTAPIPGAGLMVYLKVSPDHVKMTSLQYRYYKMSFINDIWPRVLFVHHTCSCMQSSLG